MSTGIAFFSLCFPALFAIVDPIGVVPVYLALVANEPLPDHRRTAIRATITGAAVLLVFAATGTAIFRFFGITIPAFKLAGGVLLFTVALEMMRAKQSPVKTTPEETASTRAGDDIAVTPIGIPLISGPGAIATVILWSSRAAHVPEKVSLYLSIALVIAITLVSLLFASRLLRVLGKTGINVVTRIMGLILAATAAQFVVDGWREAMGR